MKKELKPSDFSQTFPWGSENGSGRMESEKLALRILRQMTDWPDLPDWETYYQTMTQADKGVASLVKRDFERIIKYLDSPKGCSLFSPEWANIYNEAS